MDDWEATLRSLRGDYIREAPARLGEIERSLEALVTNPEDRAALDELHRGFHGFAGSGTTYGFPEVTAAARKGELGCASWLGASRAPSLADLAGWRNVLGRLEAEFVGAGLAPREEDAPAAALPRPSRDVLVVDDDPALVRLVSHHLEQEGLAIRRAGSIAEAMRALDERMPDACVIDLRLPDGSGYALVKHLRARRGGDSVPVLILSMLTGFLDKVEAIHCGADGYFEKPVDWAALLRRLVHLLERSSPDRRRILCVEDDPAQSAFLRAVLESAGYDVRVTADPNRFDLELSSFRPDLVLMDILLPGGLSGFDLMRYLRQDERHATLPALFLSTESQLAARVEAARVGGDDHLAKPVSPGLLLTAVASRVERARFLRGLMERDGLTRLLTHTAFLERARGAVARKHRDPRLSAAWVMLDLDHFKSINDRHGHPVGDRVLAAAGALLRRRLRQTDTIGRYGGEEFALLLEDLGEADAARLVDRLREEFADLVHRGAAAPGFHATFSAGVAMLGPDDDLEGWQKAADEALYAAKRAGRNRVQVAAIKPAVLNWRNVRRPCAAGA